MEIRPGLQTVDRYLRIYIQQYKYRFSREDHIQLVKLYYSIITSPELDAAYVKTFCSTFNKLLEHPNLIPRSEMELDWRPLHQTYRRFHDNPKESWTFYVFLMKPLRVLM